MAPPLQYRFRCCGRRRVGFSPKLIDVRWLHTSHCLFYSFWFPPSVSFETMATNGSVHRVGGGGSKAATPQEASLQPHPDASVIATVDPDAPLLEPHQYQYERANNTLVHITGKDLAKSDQVITQDNIDDIVWAIKELDGRNAALRRAMDTDPDCVLTTEDVRGLEGSVEAIRKMYQWIAAGRDMRRRQESQKQITDTNGRPVAVGRPGKELEESRESEPPKQITNGEAPTAKRSEAPEAKPKGAETLKSIAEEAGITLNELRYHNPDLEDYRGTDPLPPGVKIRIPKTKKNSRPPTPTEEEAPGSRRRAPPPPSSRRQVPPRSSRVEEEEYVNEEEGKESPYYDRRRVDRRPGGRGPSVASANTASSVGQKLIEGELTLAMLARECRMSIEDIIEQNPNLDRYDDHETIPYHEPIEVRRYDNNRQDHWQGDARGRGDLAANVTSGGRDRRTIAVSRGDTIYSIARNIARCEPREVRELNPDLDDFGDHDTLPTGMVIDMPPSYSDTLRDMRAGERRGWEYDVESPSPPRARRTVTRSERTYPDPNRSRQITEERYEEEWVEEDVYDEDYRRPPPRIPPPPRTVPPKPATRSFQRPSRSPAALPGETVEAGTSTLRGAQTLEDIAEELQVSVDDLRRCNPETDHFSDGARLPLRLPLKVPPPGGFIPGRRDDDGEGYSPAPGSRRTAIQRDLGSSKATTAEGDTGIVTVRGDSIALIAEEFACHPDDLVDANYEALGKYRDDDRLPPGITVMNPVATPVRRGRGAASNRTSGVPPSRGAVRRNY